MELYQLLSMAAGSDFGLVPEDTIDRWDFTRQGLHSQ